MHQLPKLSYQFQDFEPYIDIHTMGLHYRKHHQNYIDKLNTLLLKNNYKFQYNLNELIFHINEFLISDREDILFNLGGVLNHNLYWKSINPNKRQKPIGNLKKYIDKFYGGYEQLWQSLKETALKLKGSGYTFLVLKKDGNIDIINTKNQETPLSNGDIPIFNIDLWEHAYYLNYENDKERYLNNLENIIDFTNANEIFNNLIR